jgi:hypothetical protein
MNRSVIILLSLILFSSVIAQVKKTVRIKTNGVKQTISAKSFLDKYNVSGGVKQTTNYCGGAQISPEMMDGYSTPRPYGGKVFYIRKGKTNNLKEPVVLSFTVDTSGKFSFQLPPGTYSIIQEQQLKEIKMSDYTNTQFIDADEACLKNWWIKPYHILEIKNKDISKLNFEFYHPCFITSDIPCLRYTGPMPP